MDVIRNQSVVELNRNNIDVLKRQLEATSDRFRVGELTRTDVAQSEARLSGARTSLTQAEAQLTASRAAYAKVVGHAPGTLEKPRPNNAVPQSEDQAREAAAKNNPNVQAARNAEAASRAAISVAKGALLPSFDVQAQYQYGREASSGVHVGDETSVIGVLTVPLYQGGAEYSRVREAKELHNQAMMQIASAQRAVDEAVRNAWEAVRSARSSIISSEEQVKANEIALEGVKQEEQVGSQTTLDVLNAEQELLNARVTLVTRTEELRGIDFRGALQAGAGGVGRIRHPRQAQRVARTVMLEGGRVFVAVFQRLAQREVEMQPVLGVEVAALQLRAHAGDVGIVEAEGLEVGQAPPCVAEARLEFGATPVGGDRALRVAGGLQRVPQAQPDPGLVRMPGEDALVQPDRFLVIAGAAQHDRLEVAVAGVAGIAGQQVFDLGQRVLRTIAAVQDHGVVLARGMEARGQLQAALEQAGGILVTAYPGGDLGQHADRGDIGRHALQPGAQQRLGAGNVVLDQGSAGCEQDRIGHSVAERTLHAGPRLGEHLIHAPPDCSAEPTSTGAAPQGGTG